MTSSFVAVSKILKIIVHDTGIGIEENQKNMVFQLLSNVDVAKKGMGLGLVICKEIIR